MKSNLNLNVETPLCVSYKLRKMQARASWLSDSHSLIKCVTKISYIGYIIKKRRAKDTLLNIFFWILYLIDYNLFKIINF